MQTESWGAGIAQFTAAAVSGGVGSMIAGGKFENGAVTAAFGYLFNNCLNRPGGCRGFAQEAFNRFVGAISFSPPVPVGVTVEASTFVVDYGLSIDTNGRVYGSVGRSVSILPSETPGMGLKIHFTDRVWSSTEKYEFFDGASYSLSVSGAGVSAGTSYSPSGPTTFLRTTDIGVSTQQGLGLSTGMSNCFVNCPKNK